MISQDYFSLFRSRRGSGSVTNEDYRLLIRKTFFAGALLAACGATMSPASAAMYHANPAFRGAVAYRMPVRQARGYRAPVGYRLPARPARVAVPRIQGAYNRFARPAIARPAQAYSRNRVARPAYAYNRFARPAYGVGRRAYRGYGRVATRAVPAAAVRRTAMIPTYAAPRAAVAPMRTPVALGTQTGGASYYSGGRTASGGFVGAATCAHRSLPFGTKVVVTNLANARQTMCTVNDRGPFVGGRIVDLSRGAAGAIGMLGAGVAPVRLTVVGRS